MSPWLRLLMFIYGIILLAAGGQGIRRKEIPRKGSRPPFRNKAAIGMGLLLCFTGLMMLVLAVGPADWIRK